VAKKHGVTPGVMQKSIEKYQESPAVMQAVMKMEEV
jgi:hypothetical protein